MIASNHKSELDPFFHGHAFPRPVRYFAESDLFANAALRWAVTELGAIPVRRGESDRAALEAALASLARGEALIIYPEGDWHARRRRPEFLPGVGMLALRSGAPVVPVGLSGSDDRYSRRTAGLPVVRLKAGSAVDLRVSRERRAKCTKAADRIRGRSRRSMSRSEERARLTLRATTNERRHNRRRPLGRLLLRRRARPAHRRRGRSRARAAHLHARAADR